MSRISNLNSPCPFMLYGSYHIRSRPVGGGRFLWFLVLSSASATASISASILVLRSKKVVHGLADVREGVALDVGERFDG